MHAGCELLGSGTGEASPLAPSPMSGGVGCVVWEDDFTMGLREIRTQAEVAEILHISQPTVVNAEKRAIRKLREGLAAEYAELLGIGN